MTRGPSHRLFRLLLGLYPREFRRLYADEMEAAFARLQRSVRKERGRAGVLLLWLRTAADTAVSALRERASLRGYRRGRFGALRFPRSSAAAFLADLRRDVRYALRTLARSPGFTAVVILTLGLGIGANSAVFSVVYGVLLRPLPFGEGERVVRLVQRTDDALAEDGEVTFSVSEIEDYRRGASALDGVAEYHRMSFVLTGHGEPDRVRVGVVSHDFFDVLRVRPLLGREFVAAEDRAGAPPILVLGHRYWRERFDGDPAVVGDSVLLNGTSHRIVGVLPPYPQFPQENDVYMPVSACPTRSSPEFIAGREERMMSVFGRLAPGATLAAAREEVAAVAAGIAAGHPRVYPPEAGYRAGLEPVHEELVARARAPLLLLLGVAGIVLLVACANAANLALARSVGRAEELSVRRVLGAGRGRLARQLLTEAVLLAVAGGAFGLLLAVVGLDALVGWAARFTPRAAEIEIDRHVLLFTLLASVGVGLAFGALPALAGRRGPPRPADGATGSGTPTRRGRALQRGLVVVQVAVTFTVLTGAGLMLRSVWALHRVDTGFDTEDVVAASVTLQGPRYGSYEAVEGFFAEVLRRLDGTPGVVAASRAMEVPLQDDHRHVNVFHVLDDESGPPPVAAGAALAAAPPPGAAGFPAQVRTVSARYFDVVGMGMLEGRSFLASDTEDAPFVAVVNETFARTAFQDGDAVGRRLVQCWEAACNPPMTVVGVVGDTRTYGPERETPPEVYRGTGQVVWGGERLLLRIRGAAADAPSLLVQAVHSVDPDVPVSGVTTLEAARHEMLAPRRLTATLLVLFAAVAVGLTLAGIFGVLSLTARSRSREIAVRRALGARAGEVRGMVVGEGLALVAAGLAVGTVLSLALGSRLGGLLWGVEGGDPVTLAAVAVLFLGASALACDYPARRASATDVSATLQGP